MSDGFKRKVVNVGPSTLPPPGYKRDEELKKRTDHLDEAGEKLAQAHDIHTINPDLLKPDREILAHMNELHVTFSNPGYHYEWVTFDAPANNKGYMVKMKLGERIQVSDHWELLGWEVVRGDMKESEELKQPDGSRKLGDCILMRLRKERYELLEAYRTAMRNFKERGVVSGLKELGRKHASKGVIVHADLDEMDDKFKKVIMHPSPQAAAAMRGAQAAREKLDQNIRTGEIDLVGAS